MVKIASFGLTDVSTFMLNFSIYFISAITDVINKSKFRIHSTVYGINSQVFSQRIGTTVYNLFMYANLR